MNFKFIGCKIYNFKNENDVFKKQAPANIRASSRGKTEGASVIWNNWA